MRLYLSVILFWTSLLSVHAQSDYWQQQVRYDITATLDTASHTLKAISKLNYINNSPDQLDTIYFHIWANSMRSKSTPFADQNIKLGMTEFHFAKESQLGGYTSIEASLSDSYKQLSLKYKDTHEEMAYLVLPNGLSSGDSVNMTFVYELDIPEYFARLGVSGSMYNMVAWYPKPAVYDRDGWHTMPYLSLGEFYSEFGDYNVDISVPEGYQVAHSGDAFEEFTAYGMKNYRTTLVDAHDYAWFASPSFDRQSKDVELNNGQVVQIQIYRDSQAGIWEHAMEYAESVLKFMTSYMGDYPYSTLSIVQGEDSGIGGAMEYPSIKMIKSIKTKENLEYYIAHEIAHAWFYGALGSDERTESYFDEGLATFLEQKYTEAKYYGANHYDKILLKAFTSQEKPTLRHVTEGQICRHMHQPLSTPIEELSTLNYGLNAYQIGSTLIAHIESLIGGVETQRAIASFYQEWKFKHPTYSDLLRHIERESGLFLDGYDDIIAGKQVDWSISKVEDHTIHIVNEGEAKVQVPVLIKYEDESSERIITAPREVYQKITKSKKIKSVIIDPEHTSLDINRTNNRHPGPSIAVKFVPGLDRSDQSEIYVSPLLGYNANDGILLGFSAYNSTFPAKDLKWNITPFYGVHTGELVGQSWISYDTRPQASWIRKIQYRLGVKSFSFFHDEGTDEFRRYFRIDPAIILHHKHSPASKKYSKTALRQLAVLDEVNIGVEGADYLKQYITRLSHTRYNFDALQPSELTVSAEYNRYSLPGFDLNQYVKLGLDYRYGIKYNVHKQIDFRLFAATFLYNTRRESSSFDGLLTKGSIALLSQGFTDYSHDDYFLDRKGNSKNSYRQVGFHGGGFKDALGQAYSRIGQSNDFAMAINMKTDIPVISHKLPLRLFFDVGYLNTKSFTSDPLEGQLLYSGGVMLQFGDNIFNVYLPILGSSDITDIYAIDNRNLLSKITFSMDLHRFNPWDLIDDFNF